MMEIHHAWVMNPRPCPRRAPHVGVVGLTPNPRNDRVLSARIARAVKIVN
jgi:hypothetical protein